MPPRQETLNFLEFLQTFRRGDLISRADVEMEELITAIRETGGSGTLTIKLPFKLNKAGQLECTPVIDAKMPRPAMGTGIYYAGEDGRLTRSDPRQMDIDDVINLPPRSGAN